MTAILGVSAFYHESAAAIVVDGDIVAAAQEERFTRQKYDARFPTQSIAYCLHEAGLKTSQLDYVAFYDKPLTKFERLLETYFAYAPSGLSSFNRAMPVWLKKKLFIRRDIVVALQVPPTRRSFLWIIMKATPQAHSFPAPSMKLQFSRSTALVSGALRPLVPAPAIPFN